MTSGSFAVSPSPDSDFDGLPDPWEEEHGFDPLGTDNSTDDPDMDGLSNREEFNKGTDPNKSDTDGRGESDSSECTSGRDPLWILDDMIAPVAGFEVSPLPAGARILWTRHPSHSAYELWRRLSPTGPWILVTGGLISPTGIFDDSGLTNNQTYDYKLVGVSSVGTRSGNSEILSVTPVADPFAPTGAVLINSGDAATASRKITLSLTADADAIEMRLSSGVNEANDEIDDPWQPFQALVPWRISNDTQPSELFEIFVQFRDAAGNVSDVEGDTILLQADVIPTTSEWGMIVLSTLLLTCATIIFARRRVFVADQN